MTTVSRPVQVAVVENPGCHFCDDAHAVLAGLARDGHAIQVTSLDARAADGQALMREHRAAMTPLVLVDGSFFSQGRLPRRKLLRLIGA